jgi:signal transduction histidine kinase
MSDRRPRLVMAAATLVLTAVLAAFAIALVRSQDAERDDALGRFTERAQVSGALTDSLFASTSTPTAEQAADRYGGPTVDERVLRRETRRDENAMAVITDAEGRVLASTSEDAVLAARIANSPSVVKVQEGAQYTLSDHVALDEDTDGLIYAVGFDTDHGRRVRATVFGGPLISQFLGGYLGRIPGAKTTQSYIVDSGGRVIASAVKGQRPGDPVAEKGLVEALADGKQGVLGSGSDERFFASVPVSNSTWKVVLTAKVSDLYAGISTTVEWLILAALAIAGAFALVALYRTTQAAVQVQEAYDRLEETNDELGRSNLELQRSNAELEQFASVASHDLQEPLRKVQTFGDQLERRFGDDIPEEGLDYLRRMRRAAGRMSVLIEDLLRFSRVTTRAQPPEPVDLTRIAHEVASDLETAIAEAHADVRIGALPTLDADPSQMRQLLQNLIANAIKFGRPGIAPEVDLRTVKSEPGTVSFEVVDNGIGIESEYLDRIFRVFERLHPRDVYEGTGIGLALCRKIAERHGGRIDVTSTPDQGSSFRVVLPTTHQNGHAPPVEGQRTPLHA